MTMPTKVDEVKLFGTLDRCLSETKFVVDNPEQFDSATFQTLKHHVEDMELLCKYVKVKLERIKTSLPPAPEQAERGY